MYLSATEPGSRNALTGGFYPLTVSAVRHDIRDALTVTLDAPPEWKPLFQFVQGQHLNVRAQLNGAEVRRSYSICSAVPDGLLRIAIKRVPGGIFSNWSNDTLRPGCTLEVMPPTGGFHLPLSPANAKHYLGIAAGSGITPVFSILKTTLLTEPKSRFTLFFGNRASSTVMFRDELADLKDEFMERLTLVHITSRERQDLELFNGRITGAKCKELLKQWCPVEDVDAVFLCGPPSMMDDLTAMLQGEGVPASHIKMELFSAPNPAPRAIRRVTPAIHSKACEVKFILDGAEHVVHMDPAKESILDAGLADRLDLRYSCKSGVCGTCRCKKLEGEVDMDAHYALEDYEIARGFILACQSYPVSDRVVVDFDRDT